MTGQIIARGKSTWLVRMSLGRDPSTGKRKYHNRTIKGTKKDAERYLNKIRREKDVSAFVQPSSRTLAEFIPDWLNTIKAGTVRPRTLDDYRDQATRHLVPQLGCLKLSQLTTEAIDKHYTALRAQLSARTIRYVHSVLHGALEQAVKWQLIAINPAKMAALPRKETREMKSLTEEQARSFLLAAQSDRFEALWYLLLTGGIRPGEALAAKWSDLVGGQLQIQRSLSRRSDGSWSFHEPKTARARRSVSIPPSTLAAMQRHRAKQAESRLLAGAAWQDHGLIFCNGSGRPLEWRLISQRHFRKICRQVGIYGIRPYDLRHTCATLLLRNNESVKVVSERLGHHSAALTLDVYAHVLPDMGKQAGDRLESLLFAAT